jgi:beta-mannanase
MKYPHLLSSFTAILILALLVSCSPPPPQPNAAPIVSEVPVSTSTVAQPATAVPAEAAPTISPTSSPSTPGVYLGTFHGTSSSSLRLFEQIGKGIAISGVYLNWRSAFNSGLVTANAYVGRTTMITWEFMPGASQKLEAYEGRVLEGITDGLYDEYIASWAAGMVTFGKPVLLRFGHEMNGDWYAWSGFKNGGAIKDGFGDPAVADGPERFVAAFRYLHDAFVEQGADNVLWVWCPNASFEAMQNSLGEWNNAAAYYPGDAYVDWLCFDGYNFGTTSFGQSFNSKWVSFDEIFKSSYAELQAISPDKPIIIGEFSSTEEGGDKAAWITDAFSKIENDYPQIRAIIWFHIAKETDWRINSSDAALDAYRKAVSDDYWISEWPGMKP